MSTLTQIKSLIYLLDDPDENVYGEVRNALFKMGHHVVPELEEHLFNRPGDELQEQRLSGIIREIRVDGLCKSLSSWKNSSDHDLLTGLTLICNYAYPELKKSHIEELLDDLIKKVWLECNDRLTGIEKVHIVNQILFKELGFEGDRDGFHNPENSFLNDVLIRRKGNPVSLSVLYILVAQAVEIPVRGVNTPAYFLAGFENPLYRSGKDVPEQFFLFYINAFSRGTLLDYKQIYDFATNICPDSGEELYTPCSNIEIVVRCLNNLIQSYEKTGNQRAARDIEKLKSVFSE